MENPSTKEEKIIKDIRNLFRLKKQLNYTARDLFKKYKNICKKYKKYKKYKKSF